jgi:hypothetical protein
MGDSRIFRFSQTQSLETKNEGSLVFSAQEVRLFKLSFARFRILREQELCHCNENRWTQPLHRLTAPYNDTTVTTGSTHCTLCPQDSWKAFMRSEFYDSYQVYRFGGGYGTWSHLQGITQKFWDVIVSQHWLRKLLFSVMISYRIIDIYRRFGGMCFFHLQDNIIRRILKSSRDYLPYICIFFFHPRFTLRPWLWR